MKVNKIFAIAMAALALVACEKKSTDEPTGDQKLSLDKVSLSVKVDETKTLTANMDATFTVDDATVVQLVATGNSKSISVKGLKEGSATITATAGSKMATCAVTVTKGGVTPGPTPTVDYSSFKQLQGKKYYTMFLQEGAQNYLGSKVAYYFGPNDHADPAQSGKQQGSRWLYVWENTFSGGTATGADPFDGAEGWTCLQQITGGTWAGMGLCVAINDDNNVSGENAAEDLLALNSLKTEITNYDDWYLAVALKNSVQGAAYEFKLIGGNKKDGTGKGVESGVGTVTITPKATGEWDYQEFQLSKIQGLEFGDWDNNGSNLLTVVATPYMGGTQIDLGYAFIYKK